MIPSLIWDLGLAAIMVMILIRGYRSGFVSALIRLLGTIASYVLAALFSSKIAAWIYDTYIANSVKESVRTSFNAQVNTFSSVWDKLGINDFLSNFSLWKELGIGETVSNAANDAVRSVAISLLTFTVFLVIFLLASVIVHFLIKATRGINRVPLIGGVNRLLGGVTGVAEAMLTVYIISLAATVLVSFSKDQWVWINSSIIEHSQLMSWFLQLKLPL